MAPKSKTTKSFRPRVALETVPLPSTDIASSPLSIPTQSPAMPRASAQSSKSSTVRLRDIISGDTSIPVPSDFIQAPIEEASEFINQKKVMQRCAYVDVDYLEKNGFKVSEWLLPYKKWLGIRNCYNVKVVKAFYSNMKVTTAETDGVVSGILVSSTVRGKNFSFGWQNLNEWIGINTPELAAFNVWQNKAKYTEEELLQIYNPETPVKGVLKPAQLSIVNRLLHYAYSRVMVNKAGNFTQIMDVDNPILAMLFQKIPINPGQLVCEELLRFSKSKSKNTPLPFPQLISFILATNMIWYLDEKDNVTPPRLDLTTIKKMGIPIPIATQQDSHIPEAGSTRVAPEQAPESEGETSSSTPSVPQHPLPESPKFTLTDEIIEVIAARVAANLEPAFKTIYEGMSKLADMNKFLDGKIDGLASLFKSYLEPSMSTSPLHPVPEYQPSNLSPLHFPHTSIPSPHHTSPIHSASPTKSSTPSSSHLPPPSPPSQPIHTNLPPPEPAPSPPPTTFARTYARKGKAPIIASPDSTPTVFDDAKKGEKRHSVPTEGESSAVQELASKAATILSSIAAETVPTPADEATATLSQILPEIHQVAEGIREKFVEEVLIEDVTGEEPEFDYVNIAPENPQNVLEEEDMSKAMVIYEEPQPVTVDTFPHIRRMVREFIERMEAQEEERNEREKARAERAAEAEAQAKAEQEKKSSEMPKPVVPSWGVQRKVTYQKEVKMQDPVQTTSEFLASGGEEEGRPEVQSTKRKKIKMTAPKPPPRQIATRATRASKGIVIEEPKPAPKSAPKTASKRKAASKAKSTRPPPKKKQKQKGALERLIDQLRPPSPPKKKKSALKKAPARKKAEPVVEILKSPSVSSGGYSSESGDYDLTSKFASSASDSD